MKTNSDCVFCKIVKGEIPCHKVYEDENFLGFLDINPAAPGHSQLIPKKHYHWVWDVPADRKVSPNIAEYMEAAHQIANAQRKAFGTEMIFSRIIGTEVPHAHIWLIPHKHTQNEKLKEKQLAELIRANF